MSRASLAVLAGSFLITGCATVGGLRSEPLDQGVARRYQVPFDSVMAVLPDAIVASGLGLKESQCSDSMCLLIGTKGFSIGPSGSAGSMARVVVQADGDATIVRVLTRRRVASQTSAEDDYSPQILSQVEVRLGLTRT